jgi:cytochrome oxidase Cu insertion factor (SCO1/SenC/PrrC family)
VVRQISQAASAAGYLIDHSARTYAIDRQGRLRETFFFGTEPASVAQDVIYLLGE